MYADTSPISKSTSLKNTNQVLTQTLSLVAKAMIPTAFGAWLVSLLMPMSILPTLALIIGAFVLCMLTIWLIFKSESIHTQASLYYFITFLLGVMSGPMLNLVLTKSVIGMQIILMSAGITAMILTGVVVYIKQSTKRFDFLQPFLFGSLIAIIVASIANIFLQLPVLAMVISCVAIVIFIGYLLYDIGEVVHGGETNPVFAALNIFLDTWSIFIHLVSLIFNLSSD